MSQEIEEARAVARNLHDQHRAEVQRLISLNAPSGYSTSTIFMSKMPDGSEVYRHNGVPFLEIQPPELIQKTLPDGTMNITVTVRWRKLETRS